MRSLMSINKQKRGDHQLSVISCRKKTKMKAFILLLFKSKIIDKLSFRKIGDKR